MDVLSLIFIIIIFLFSVVIHEVAHGAAANALGDPTAKMAGRLSLNPIKHLDPVGSILVPGVLLLMSYVSGMGIIFGWARPVPINPRNLKDQRYGEAKTAIAGPLANIAVAVFFGILLRLMPIGSSSDLAAFYMVFSLIVYVNLLLALFNLLPIPPLDGHHVLFTFLPPSATNFKLFLYRYGMFILLFLIFFGGLRLIFPIINFLFVLIAGTPMLM